MYTSGTTGGAKGATLSHGNITWNALNVVVDADFRQDEIALVVAPLFHTAALNMLCLPTLLKGGAVLIEPGFEPGRALEAIESAPGDLAVRRARGVRRDGRASPVAGRRPVQPAHAAVRRRAGARGHDPRLHQPRPDVHPGLRDDRDLARGAAAGRRARGVQGGLRRGAALLHRGPGGAAGPDAGPGGGDRGDRRGRAQRHAGLLGPAASHRRERWRTGPGCGPGTRGPPTPTATCSWWTGSRT